MDFEHRRQEHVAALGYALAVATVVLCARAGLFPGAGQAHSPVGHPYRLSMAATGGLLAVLLGAATGWIGVRRGSRRAGVAALAGGGLATGAALSFAPFVLYPNDQYPVSFGWLVGGAPLAAAAWLVATLVLGRQETFAPVRSEIPRLLYGWSKSTAAGAYLVPFVLIPSGVLQAADPLWHTAAPLAAAVFAAVAGGFLVWDAGRPGGRTPPSAGRSLRRSRRVRAGVVVGAFGLVLALHFVAEPGPEPPPPGLALIAGVLAVAVALLPDPSTAHDEHRRLLLRIRLLGQALVAGAATTVLLARAVAGADHPAAASVLLFLAVASVVAVLLEAAEARLPERTWPTIHPDRRPWFRLGVAGAVAGIAAPGLAWPAALVVLGGLLAFQHSQAVTARRRPRPAPPDVPSFSRE